MRLTHRLLRALVLSTTLVFACGDSEEGIPGGNNTLIQVDAPTPDDFEHASMGIRITCTGDFALEMELEVKSRDASQTFWEGVFNLPIGACVVTLVLSCADEIVCIGSQEITIQEGDNLYEGVVLTCPLSIGTFDSCLP